MRGRGEEREAARQSIGELRIISNNHSERQINKSLFKIQPHPTTSINPIPQ